MKYMSVASALLLHYSFPVFTMLGTFLLLKEKPNVLQIFSAFLIIIGVGAGGLNSPESLVKGASIPGILWGLLAVFGISLQTLCARMMSIKKFVP